MDSEKDERIFKYFIHQLRQQNERFLKEKRGIICRDIEGKAEYHEWGWKHFRWEKQMEKVN